MRRPGDHRCDFCGKPMKRRSEENDPAYCTYECGANGQPEHVRKVLRNTGSGQDPAA